MCVRASVGMVGCACVHACIRACERACVHMRVNMLVTRVVTCSISLYRHDANYRIIVQNCIGSIWLAREITD